MKKNRSIKSIEVWTVSVGLLSLILEFAPHWAHTHTHTDTYIKCSCAYSLRSRIITSYWWKCVGMTHCMYIYALCGLIILSLVSREYWCSIYTNTERERETLYDITNRKAHLILPEKWKSKKKNWERENAIKVGDNEFVSSWGNVSHYVPYHQSVETISTRLNHTLYSDAREHTHTHDVFVYLIQVFTINHKTGNHQTSDHSLRNTDKPCMSITERCNGIVMQAFAEYYFTQSLVSRRSEPKRKTFIFASRF